MAAYNYLPNPTLGYNGYQQNGQTTTAVGGTQYSQPNWYTQQSQVPQPQTMKGFTTIIVDGRNDVDFYPVAAGCSAMLISFKEHMFWIKSTNTSGIPEPLREFPFTENKSKEAHQNDGSFATKEELTALSNKLDKIIASLGGDE